MAPTDDFHYTLVRAKDHDLIVLFIDRHIDSEQAAALDNFVESLAENTDATIVAFPDDVVTGCQNYTLKDLLGLRELIDNLIVGQVETYPAAEA